MPKKCSINWGLGNNNGICDENACNYWDTRTQSCGAPEDKLAPIVGKCMADWGTGPCIKNNCPIWDPFQNRCKEGAQVADNDSDAVDALRIIAKLKREIEALKRDYIHPAAHEAQMDMLRQEALGWKAWADRYREQNERLRADLKKHRKYKCTCCLYAAKQHDGTHQFSPCRDCQSSITTNGGDAWVYKEPI